MLWGIDRYRWLLFLTALPTGIAYGWQAAAIPMMGVFVWALIFDPLNVLKRDKKSAAPEGVRQNS